MLKFVKDNKVMMEESDNGELVIMNEELKESFKKEEVIEDGDNK